MPDGSAAKTTPQRSKTVLKMFQRLLDVVVPPSQAQLVPFRATERLAKEPCLGSLLAIRVRLSLSLGWVLDDGVHDSGAAPFSQLRVDIRSAAFVPTRNTIVVRLSLQTVTPQPLSPTLASESQRDATLDQC